MRFLLVAVLVVALAIPATAAKPTYALVFNLTFNSDGTITGTIGGIPVSGTYSGGTWTLTIDGKTFASGTYTCNGSCTFNGTTIAGKSLTFSFTSVALVGTTSGQIVVFSNHGGWVSAVTSWAFGNLTGVRRGQIISAAAHNMQLFMQANGNGNSSATGSSQSAAKSHGSNAGGNGKGKGPK